MGSWIAAWRAQYRSGCGVLASPALLPTPPFRLSPSFSSDSAESSSNSRLAERSSDMSRSFRRALARSANPPSLKCPLRRYPDAHWLQVWAEVILGRQKGVPDQLPACREITSSAPVHKNGLKRGRQHFSEPPGHKKPPKRGRDEWSSKFTYYDESLFLLEKLSNQSLQRCHYSDLPVSYLSTRASSSVWEQEGREV